MTDDRWWGGAMVLRIWIISVMLVVGGCGIGTSMRLAELQSKRDADTARCKSSLVAGAIRSATEYTRCTSNALLEWWRQSGQEHLDLAELNAAQKVAAAEKFDRGGITELDFDLLQKQANSQLMSELQRRRANEAVIYAANSHQSVTCQRFGNIVTCH